MSEWCVIPGTVFSGTVANTPDTSSLVIVRE